MKKYYVIGSQKTNSMAACVFMNSNGKYYIEEFSTTKVGVCNLVNRLLEKIETNDKLASEMSAIYVSDAIGKAIVSGTIGSWVRTGKAGTGNIITEEEKAAAKKLCIEYGKRNLNVKILPTSYLDAKDKSKKLVDPEGKSAAKRCWAMLDRYQSANNNFDIRATTQQADPNQEAINKIVDQIAQASLKQDWAGVTALSNVLQTLKSNASVPTPAPTPQEAVNTDNDIMPDIEISNDMENNDDDGIMIDISSAPDLPKELTPAEVLKDLDVTDEL